MTRFSMIFSAIAIVILLVGGSLAAETGSSKPQSQQGTSRSSSSSSGSNSGNSESSTGSNSASASASSNAVPSSSNTGTTNIHNIANRVVPVIPLQQNSFNPLPRPLPSNTNFYTLSSVQRRRHTFRYQMPQKVATDNAAAASTSSQPEFIGVPEKITIPIGVSNYKPIKYVDTIPEIKFVDFPTFPVIQPIQPILQPVLQPVLLLQQPQLIQQAPKSTIKDVAVSSVAKANEKRQIQTPAMPPMPNRPFQDKPRTTESKPADTAAVASSTAAAAAAAPVASDNASAQSSGGNAENTDFNNIVSNAFRHKPRMIELESSYIPLTLRFSTRPRKLNIIAADNDLIGQDSNRHDRINGRAGTIDLIDPNSASLNLDTRTIFGTPRRAEPLILKRGADSKIPQNMQHIIKCIFPDFRFDGAEKVRSAC